MTKDDALLELAGRTADAVAGALQMFGVEGTDTRVSVAPETSHPLESLRLPAVATGVSYVEGVSGGNVFAITVAGARRLAAAMMGQAAPQDDAADLSELELSAVGEAMNQMMAAAAGATSAVLGYEVEIAPPETVTLTTAEEARALCADAPHATIAAFTVCGEPARLVQLVPKAFVVRMNQALDEHHAETPTPDATPQGELEAALAGSLRGVGVRVWAELGRAHMPAGAAVGLPHGAVVDLNRAAEEPIDLYVNGTRFATGRLVIADGGEWAVEIDRIAGHAPAVP